MKFRRIFGTVLFLIAILFISHAQTENHQVFVGQVESDGETQNIFAIDFMDTDINDHVYVAENGEIWIKADRLVQLRNEDFEGSFENAASSREQSLLSNMTNFTNATSDSKGEYETRYCPNCRRYWVAGPGRYYCPNCN